MKNVGLNQAVCRSGGMARQPAAPRIKTQRKMKLGRQEIVDTTVLLLLTAGSVCWCQHSSVHAASGAGCCISSHVSGCRCRLEVLVATGRWPSRRHRAPQQTLTPRDDTGQLLATSHAEAMRRSSTPSLPRTKPRPAGVKTSS